VRTAGYAGTGTYSARVGERVRSFGHALRGVWVARTGANYRIQLAGAVAAAGLAVVYGLRRTHLAVVVMSIAAVLAAELVNTAIERPCDLVDQVHSLGHDARIRDIKDLAAGAVLLVCAGAVVVGVIVFFQ
jgi:diacylglycerol kinase